MTSAAVPPHHQVGRALLAAHLPPDVAPAGYNEARGCLWVRLQAPRTLPTSAEFEQEWRRLRELLVADNHVNGRAHRRNALAALDEVWGAAVASELLDEWERR